MTDEQSTRQIKAIAKNMGNYYSNDFTSHINPSGINPIEYKVLVLPEKSELEQRAERSNLVLPDEAKDRADAAAGVGRIIAISPHAFSYEEWPEGCERPKVGQRVVYPKFTGMKITGKDGLDYKVLNDKDVACVLDY